MENGTESFGITNKIGLPFSSLSIPLMRAWKSSWPWPVLSKSINTLGSTPVGIPASARTNREKVSV